MRQCAARHSDLGVHSWAGRKPEDAIVGFLEERSIGSAYLLAYADDGVVWGRVEDGRVALPSGHTLRSVTLQEARIFNEASELLIRRRDSDRFQLRLIEDDIQEDPDWRDCIDESYLLLADRVLGAPAAGFSEVVAGSTGRRYLQSLPVVSKNGHLRVCLAVRHYVSPSCRARVVSSRMLDLVLK
jgi:CRISPR-associated protein (TIGR03984 family)